VRCTGRLLPDPRPNAPAEFATVGSGGSYEFASGAVREREADRRKSELLNPLSSTAPMDPNATTDESVTSATSRVTSTSPGRA